MTKIWLQNVKHAVLHGPKFTTNNKLASSTGYGRRGILEAVGPGKIILPAGGDVELLICTSK
jgi:hypothetical protein